MEVIFGDIRLDRLETDARFEGGYPTAIVKSFRKRMQLIRSADDERVFYAMRSLNFERLKGDRDHQHSMRLNIQWRLILEMQGTGNDKKIRVMGIEDYH